MTAFTTFDNAVHWNGIRLSDESVDALLDLYERLGDQPEARSAYHDLYDAHLQVGGIARGTSLRVVGGRG